MAEPLSAPSLHAPLANSFIRERQRRTMFIDFFVIAPQLRRSGIYTASYAAPPELEIFACHFL
jgi:hypothetical protein